MVIASLKLRAKNQNKFHFLIENEMNEHSSYRYNGEKDNGAAVMKDCMQAL